MILRNYLRNFCILGIYRKWLRTLIIPDYRIVKCVVVLAQARSLRAAQSEYSSASLSTQLLCEWTTTHVSEFHLSLLHVLPGPVECDCEIPWGMWGRQATFSRFRLSKVYLYLFYHLSLPVCLTKYIHTYTSFQVNTSRIRQCPWKQTAFFVHSDVFFLMCWY